MIEFRQKEFVLPLVPLLASTGAGIGVSAVQGSVHHKKDMAQQEDFQKRQEVEARRQNEALNRIAMAAEKDPAKAQQAAAVIQQKGFAAPAGLTKRIGNVTYDFAKALNKNGTAYKKLGQGLALGATMTAATGIGDKLIQLDRKKVTGGAPLPVPEEDKEEKAKKKRKAIAKAGVGLAAAGTAIVAARRGALGKGWQQLSKRKWSGPKGWNSGAKKTGEAFVKSAKENIMPTKESGWIGPLLTYGFPAISATTYVLGERKQLKNQAKEQQKEYADNDQKKKPGSVLKKAAIGTAAAAATIAAGRRGAFGSKAGRYFNDWYMSRGAQLSRIGSKTSKKGLENLGNKMMDSGASYWGKFNPKAVDKDIARNAKKLARAKDNKRSSIFDVFKSKKSLAEKNQQRVLDRTQRGSDLAKQRGISASKRRADILSGKEHTSITGSVLNSKPVRFITFQEGNHQNFLNQVAKEHPGTDTAKVAKFLTTGTGKTLAAAGSVGVGLAAMAPFTWGDKAVRGAARVIDKDAFAYEKSQGGNV